MRARGAVLSLLAMLLGTGCGNTEPGDAGVGCPQTAETDNFGCAVVTGTVRDAVGVPLAGATVTLVAPTGESAAYDSPFETTGADGAFRVEIHRYEAPDPVPRPTRCRSTFAPRCRSIRRCPTAS